MRDTSKLPKWAQEHIRDLERQRDTAVKSLKEWTDSQTPSAFSVDELVCTASPPELYRRYIQGHQMDINHAGMLARIMLRDDTIEISYGPEDRAIGDVVLQPYSFQQVRLFMPTVGAAS